MEGNGGPTGFDDRLHRASAWAWLLGLAALAAVVILAGRKFDPVQLARSLARADARWLAVAVALQALTYLAQGEVWRGVAGAAGLRLPLARAYALSLVKLFVDQTLPSAGVSGTIVAARALERRGLPRPAVVACVSVNLVSYYFAYGLALAGAAAAALARGHRGSRLLAAAGVFVVVGAGIGGVFLAAARGDRVDGRALSWPRRLAAYFKQADPELLRSPRLLARCGLMQLAIIAADAATVWALIRSLHIQAAPVRVYDSFMLSSVFRSIGFSPGGLGAFEASSVVTLKRAGVPLPVALSATLAFRALSFWLPMLPGLWLSRRELRAAPSPAPSSSGTGRSAPA